MEDHVVIVTHSYPRYEGDWRSNFIESLAVGYRQNGAKVTVLVPRTKRWGRQSEDHAGIRIVSYSYMPFESWHILGYGKSMKGDLKMNPLHGLLLPFLIIAGTVRLALLLRTERVSFMHAHWAVPNTIIALAARFLSCINVKIFSSFPGSDVTVISQTGVVGKVLARTIARSDYLSCNSSDLKEDLVKAGIPAQKIDCVIYGVNNQTMQFDVGARIRIRRHLGIGDDVIALLMVGRFVPKKGFTTGIKAMQAIRSRHSNARLLIVGSGLLEPEYRGIMKESGTEEAITLLGEVLPAELKYYYSACDIFLMPSERFPSDGLNVVVVEAMACGRPVVASSVGGNDLVVFDGVNGYLHRAGDAEDLAAKVEMLIDDRHRRLGMGIASKSLVDDRFNWKAIAAYYLAHYHALQS
jgi:glycosyltransferase involved in cell wall biosynthesis